MDAVTPSAPELNALDSSDAAPRSAAVAPGDGRVPEPSYVYALGQIEPRFPSLAVEKEFAQAFAHPSSAGLDDRQLTRETLSARENRYLARHLCWVLLTEGLETYILTPADPLDLDLLIDAYREQPRRDDLDVVIGRRGPIAPPELCNGLALPLLVFEQIYSFDRDTLIESIPPPDGLDDKALEAFRRSAGSLFDTLMQLADNAGATDEHRALNYLSVRYPRIYAVASEMLERNHSFSAVEVAPSRLSGARRIATVVFSFRHRETDVVEKRFVRVDVSEAFPFLVTKMSPYYDR